MDRLALDRILEQAAHTIPDFQQRDWETDERNLRESRGLDDVLSEAELSVELLHLSAVNRSGHIDNFVPLLLILRYMVRYELMAVSDYLWLLKAVDCFIYRTYLIGGLSDSCWQNELYGLAVFLLDKLAVVSGIDYVHAVIVTVVFKIHIYSYSLNKVESFLRKPFELDIWEPFVFKFTLFEYERQFDADIEWEDYSCEKWTIAELNEIKSDLVKFVMKRWTFD